jgi:hypothetical protein
LAAATGGISGAAFFQDDVIFNSSQFRCQTNKCTDENQEYSEVFSKFGRNRPGQSNYREERPLS